MKGDRIVWGALAGATLVAALVGGALLVASATAPGQAFGPTAAPDPANRSNPKVEAASRNTPPPAPPSPRRWSAHTIAEVQANLVTDANYAGAIGGLSSGPEPDPRAVGHVTTLGTPLFVRGLAPGDANEYLVPVNVGGTTIAIIKVGVDAKGMGQLDAVRGWSTTTTFPATTEAAALTRASTPGDAAVKAELVWTEIRAVAGELQPFWRLERASGVVYFLFEDGKLVAASEAGF
jgi:hypothetical protein